MQFGSRVKLLVVLSVVAALWCAMSDQPSMAQFLDQDSGYGAPAQRRSPPWGAAQALFTPGRWKLGGEQTPYVDANGKPVVVPAGYLEQCPGGCPGACAGPAPCGPAPCGPGCGPGGPYDGHCGGPAYGGFTGPYPMGAGGTDPPVGYDLMEDVGVAGFLVDQRGPHYWDLRAHAVRPGAMRTGLRPGRAVRRALRRTGLRRLYRPLSDGRRRNRSASRLRFDGGRRRRRIPGGPARTALLGPARRGRVDGGR